MEKASLSFNRLSSIRQRKKGAAGQTSMPSSPPPMKTKKKRGGASSRLWMIFDRSGTMEVMECNKRTIIKRASLPARDLRILGPLFSHSSNILGREKAIIVNLEVIKAIITAEEVMLLDPLCPEVIPLIDRLKQQFTQASSNVELEDDLESELPFEFQVLEIALEIVCSYFDNSLTFLEREACPILDELTKNASNETLQYVRSLKTNISNLLARVQKVRNTIEYLLDDDEDMANLYLTRKQTQPNINVEDLEMLLEAYFIQLEGMRNKIIMMRKHIDDTEDYVKIKQNNRRNGMIQLKLMLNMASFAITTSNAVVSLFGMNIPMPLYNTNGVFGYVVLSVVALCIGLFVFIFCYARWKKLLDL